MTRILTRADVAALLTMDDCLRAVEEVFRAGRCSDDEVFVFDSTGTALQDVAVASVAYARAGERGVGIEVELR